jgi:hypothetical protein
MRQKSPPGGAASCGHRRLLLFLGLLVLSWSTFQTLQVLIPHLTVQNSSEVDGSQFVSPQEIVQAETAVKNSSHLIEQNQALLNKGEYGKLLNNPLHDKTLDWDPTVQHQWLDPNSTRPPAMLLLTNTGWNQPDQEEGIKLWRSWRGRMLTQGVINQ